MHPAPKDLSQFRSDFPILRRRIGDKPLVYLDSAATALKPQAVIDAVVRFYTECTANVRRAVHALSEEATEAFEASRERIARFIQADPREIVFVRHATEALNLVAASYRPRGQVAVSPGEHHSNLLPWRPGKPLFLDLDPSGRIDLDKAARVLRAEKPVLLALSTVSNALGLHQPFRELAAIARETGTHVLLDASQSVGHEPVHVGDWDCDYLCFSGHKMLGPDGVGVLYVRTGREQDLEPLLLGGSMVQSVGPQDHESFPVPWGLEAGTPNIEGVFGLAAACDYLEAIGLDHVQAHNHALIRQLRDGLRAIPRVRTHGDGASRSSIVSFSMEGIQAHGIARILSNRFGIMVRSGFHCAQPLHLLTRLPESVRVSVHLYNTPAEIEQCVQALHLVSRMP